MNSVSTLLVFWILTGALLVTPISSEMLTIRSLIWTVQLGLKREKPSAISLMAYDPADWGGAGDVAGGATSWVAMMTRVTASSASLLTPNSSACHSLTSGFTGLSEKRKFFALESLSPRSVCGKTQSEYLCVFFRWQQPNRKHSCGEGDGPSTFRAHQTPVRQLVGKKVTTESSDK